MSRMRPCDRSPIWLALYSVCFVCVLSFVFFEMLDVDGSDFDGTNFKTPTMPLRLGLRQSATESVRVLLQQRAALAGSAITLDLRSVPVALSTDRSRPAPVALVVGHSYRVALPRASLETAPSRPTPEPA